MKKLLYLILPLILPVFISLPAFSQNNEGTVQFSEIVKLKIEVPEGMDEAEFRKMMPEEQKADKVLLFNANESLWSDAPDQKPGGKDVDINHETDEGNMRMDIKIQRPENYQYRNIADGERIESTEFFGRFFLIKETPKKMKWKIGAEQKKIAGYLCQKAVLQDTTRQVEAWFTTQLPLSFGPAEFADLPGMILEVSIDNGARSYVAEKVELKALDKKAIQKPTKGKSVTREEYTKIRDEKMKEMGAEPGGGGMMKVIIRN